MKAVRKCFLHFLKAISLPSTVRKLGTLFKIAICAISIVSGKTSAPSEGTHPVDSLLG